MGISKHIMDEMQVDTSVPPYDEGKEIERRLDAILDLQIKHVSHLKAIRSRLSLLATLAVLGSLMVLIVVAAEAYAILYGF